MQSFVLEILENQRIKSPINGEIISKFEKLNKFFYKTLKNNITFLYITRRQARTLVFYTKVQFEAFISTLIRIDKQLFYDIQVDNSLNEIETFIARGIFEVLKMQFGRCNLNIADEQFYRLQRYYRGNDLLDLFSGWLPRIDHEGEILLLEDPEKKYSWFSFVLDLQINYDPYFNLFSTPGSEKDYMLLFENANSSFPALIRTDHGLLVEQTIANWSEYLKRINNEVPS